MAESFGARMRERREQRQISLIAISELTKIKRSHLEALERDDVSQWPTGIFRRAYIRAYAHAVDLEPDAVVREFLERYPDPDESVVPVPAVEPGAEHRSHQPAPPMRLRFLVRSAMDSVTRAWIDLGRRSQPLANRPAADERPLAADQVARPAPPAPPVPAPAGAGVDSEVNSDCEATLARESLDAARILQQAARLLDAVGLVVWTWDPQLSALVPAFSHGYSDRVRAQLPTVRRDADNATAAAFRSTQTCIVRSNETANGAVVVPMMTPAGCVGVFAVELPCGAEQREPVRALTTSLAARFADLVAGAPRLPHAATA